MVRTVTKVTPQVSETLPVAEDQSIVEQLVDKKAEFEGQAQEELAVNLLELRMQQVEEELVKITNYPAEHCHLLEKTLELVADVWTAGEGKREADRAY